MGIDYGAIAGYGIKIDDNLTEEGQIIRDGFEDIDDFINSIGSKLEWATSGNEYVGRTQNYIICSDPLNKDGRYDSFKKSIEKNKKLFKDTTIKWICDIYIS